MDGCRLVILPEIYRKRDNGHYPSSGVKAECFYLCPAPRFSAAFLRFAGAHCDAAVFIVERQVPVSFISDPASMANGRKVPLPPFPKADEVIQLIHRCILSLHQFRADWPLSPTIMSLTAILGSSQRVYLYLL